MVRIAITLFFISCVHRVITIVVIIQCNKWIYMVHTQLLVVKTAYLIKYYTKVVTHARMHRHNSIIMHADFFTPLSFSARLATVMLSMLTWLTRNVTTAWNLCMLQLLDSLGGLQTLSRSIRLVMPATFTSWFNTDIFAISLWYIAIQLNHYYIARYKSLSPHNIIGLAQEGMYVHNMWYGWDEWMCVDDLE